MNLSYRSFAWVLFAIVLSGGAIRTAISVHREWIGYDEANYLMIARNASAGEGYLQSPLTGYAAKFHPLSYLAPQAVARILGDELIASKFLFVTLGMLSIGLIGLIGKELFSPRVGLLSAALVAVAPALTSLLAASISHTLFLPFFLGGCLLAWRAAEGGRYQMALLSGVAIGLCWWARADGLLVAPTLSLFLLVGSFLLTGSRSALKNTVAFLLGFTALYLAYGFFVNEISQGTGKAHGALFDFLVFPPDCNSSRDLLSYGSLTQLALNEPQCIAAAIVENLDVVPSVLFTWTGFPIFLIPFLGAGWLFSASGGRRMLAAHLLILAAILPLAFYLPFYYSETRYVAPYAAIAFLWCARGILAVSRELESLAPRLATTGLVALVLSCLLSITIVHTRRMDTMGGLEYVRAGQWIDKSTESNSIVLTSQAQVGYYARRPWMYPPGLSEDVEWREIAEDQLLLVRDERKFLDKNGEWKRIRDQLDQVLSEPVYEDFGSGPALRIYRLDPGSIERLIASAAEASGE